MQVQRVHVDSHLQSAMRLHLDLACVKLINTEANLNDTDAKLNDAHIKLNETKEKLSETEEKLEATPQKVVEKLETRMFTWRIDNFSETLRQRKVGGKNSKESVPFYTDRTGSYGYKLKARIYPNDRWVFDNDSVVSIVVMKGEYDAILPWPFKNKVQMTLIDQHVDPLKRKNITHLLISEKGFPRPVNDGEKECSFARFSHETLHSRRYLEDDTLFLQFEISLL